MMKTIRALAHLLSLVMLSVGLGYTLTHLEETTSAADEKPVAESVAESAATGKDKEAAAKEAPAKEPAKEKAAKAEATGCIVDPLALEDLRKRREELDAKQKALAMKESELKRRESAIEEELKRLDDQKAAIALDRTASDAQAEEKLAKLVETIENMSPKKASELISTVEDRLAVSAMSRISTLKLSKIMNNLEPARAARLSEMMTGYLAAKRKLPVPTASIETAQKGDTGNAAHDSSTRNPSSSR